MEGKGDNQLLTQIQDRTLSAIVSLVSLCPKMDLLAVALDRNSIAIFRTTWQRLATIPICANADDVITSITWSPTGAYLAIATSSAALLIHSVDRTISATASRTRRAARETDPVAQITLPSPASVVSWISYPSLHHRYEDRASLLLDAKPNFLEPNVDPVSEPGLLFVADRDGMLTMLTSNLAFIIARVRVVLPQFVIHNLHVMKSLRHCLIVAYRETDSDGATPTSHNCLMRTVRIDVLLEYLPEIDRVTQEVLALKAHFASFEATMKRIEDSWVEGARGVLTNSIVKPLERVMLDYSETPSTWDKLYNAFCGARVRGGLLHFLANSIGENGAKELLRSFRVHDEDTEETIFKMLSLAENALSRASEYRGLSRILSRFAPIGVLLPDADEVFDATDALFAGLAEFAHGVEVVSSETEAFLAWLIIAALKAGGEAGQGRSASSSDTMKARETELAAKFLAKMTSIESPTPLVEGADSVDVMFSTKLRPLLKCWRRACEQVMSRPCEVLSGAFGVMGGVMFPAKMGDSTLSYKCCVYDQMCLDAEREDAVILFLSMCNGGLLCIRHEVYSRLWSFAQRGLRADGVVIHDAVMASNTAVVFVASDHCEEQVPDKDKVHCQVGVCDMASCELWNEGNTILGGEEEAVGVGLGNMISLSGTTTEWSFSGKKEKICDLSLSSNRDTGVMRSVTLFFSWHWCGFSSARCKG